MEVIQSFNEEEEEGLIVEPFKTVWVEETKKISNEEGEKKRGEGLLGV